MRGGAVPQELQGRFWDAILAGSAPRVAALLDEGAEISTRLGAEDWGKHPLHAAAASSNMEVVQLLLARGALPNTLDYASDPPLWHAVEHGLVDMVMLLLDNKSTSSDLHPEGKVGQRTSPAGSSAHPIAAHGGCSAARPWLRVHAGAGA